MLSVRQLWPVNAVYTHAANPQVAQAVIDSDDLLGD